MAQFPFVGGSSLTRSRNLDAQRCINLYPELGGPGAKSAAMLVGTPGKRFWKFLAGGTGVRGLFRFSPAVAVAVVGQNVYTLDVAGTATLRGTIDSGVTPARMASNGIVVMIVTGPYGYVLDPALGTLTAVADSDFTGADTVQFIDGYFAFNKPNTGRFQITNLYSTSIDTLDFATAEGAPGLLLSLLADHRELWLFCEKATEVWFNSGNADFPFERIQGAFIEQGCAAKFSPAKLDNTVYWLTQDQRGYGTVQRAEGYNPKRVSDHALEFAIGQMSRIDDAFSWTYQQEGHSFYVLTFPTAEQTWVFDAASNLWHQRAWRQPSDGELKRDRASCQMNFAGETIVGDWETGKLYILDLDHFMDGEDPILRLRSCPHIASPDYHWQFFDALQVDMQTGVGLSAQSYVQGSNPMVRLRWSDDGGYAWSNYLLAALGKIGERTARVIWRRLGRSRDRVFEVSVTDPVRVVMIGASTQVRLGSS